MVFNSTEQIVNNPKVTQINEGVPKSVIATDTSIDGWKHGRIVEGHIYYPVAMILKVHDKWDSGIYYILSDEDKTMRVISSTWFQILPEPIDSLTKTGDKE